jgi:hypothetical protein
MRVIIISFFLGFYFFAFRVYNLCVIVFFLIYIVINKIFLNVTADFVTGRSVVGVGSNLLLFLEL